MSDTSGGEGTRDLAGPSRSRARLLIAALSAGILVAAAPYYLPGLLGAAVLYVVSASGQAPSVHPEYAEFLVRCGIDSVSVNPDALEVTRRNIAAARGTAVSLWPRP